MDPQLIVSVGKLFHGDGIVKVLSALPINSDGGQMPKVCSAGNFLLINFRRESICFLKDIFRELVGDIVLPYYHLYIDTGLLRVAQHLLHCSFRRAS